MPSVYESVKNFQKFTRNSADMREFKINTNELSTVAANIKVGDRVILSGTVYTARDAAHKRIFELLDSGTPLPFSLKDAVIYYAGPTPTPPNLAIGSCGPTTSSRMDAYSPRLFDLGVKCVIGKGDRSEEVAESIVKNGALYLCAIGGCGALAAARISECEVIAFPELGCESVKRLTFKDFPLICAIDTKGGNLFKLR